MMIVGLVLPALIVMLFAFLLPRALAAFLPEGVGPLLLIGALSALVLFILSVAYFIWAYAVQNVAVIGLLGENPRGALWHFIKLGFLSGLLWGPVLVLTVSALPARWTDKQW